MLSQVDKPDLGETGRGIPVREVPGRGNPPGQWGEGKALLQRCKRDLSRGWKVLLLSCAGGDTGDYSHQTSLTLTVKWEYFSA